MEPPKYSRSSSTANCLFLLVVAPLLLALKIKPIFFQWLGPFTPKMMQLVRFGHDSAHDNLESSVQALKQNVKQSGKRTNRNEDYRIIILPWPAFTDAYKIKQLDQTVDKGGDLIEGKWLVNQPATFFIIQANWELSS